MAADFNEANTLISIADAKSLDVLRRLLGDALDVLGSVGASRDTPVPAGGPAASRAFGERAFGGGALLPEQGDPVGALTRLITAYASWAVDIGHPATAARMQCPPLGAAVVADLVAGLLNQSLHAWEAGPAGLELERHLIGELAALVGYGPEAGGTFTAGGSISNIMSMLVARDVAFHRRFGSSGLAAGLSGRAARPVVLCTDTVHFSVDRGAGIAGIGIDNILRVPTDSLGRMLPEQADRMLGALTGDDVPVILLVCAGSTDYGLVDPLPELAEVARRHGVWLHADAAFGGGALFSDTLRPMFAGIEQADSVTMDLHKYGWTPAPAGVFLVKREADLGHLAAQQTSLNAPDDVAEGFVGRYGTSLQATRRVDALKIAAMLGSLGRRGVGDLVDACHGLALGAAARIEREPRLELAATPALSSVLFRFRPAAGTEARADAFNSALRRELMRRGSAMLARVFLQRDSGRRVFLKLMLLNPATEPAQLDAVIDTVLALALELEAGGD